MTIQSIKQWFNKAVKWMRNKSVFKKIQILLAHPICSCDEQNIDWSIWLDKDNYSGLKLRCKTCDTTLIIPNKKFVASIIFDQPYPGKKKEKPKTDLKLLDGGKVLDFKPNDDETKPKSES